MPVEKALLPDRSYNSAFFLAGEVVGCLNLSGIICSKPDKPEIAKIKNQTNHNYKIQKNKFGLSSMYLYFLKKF